MNVGTMLKNKRVLVNGCSFSRGPAAWPYHLQQALGFDLTNLAVASAGNRYIHDTTIAELANNNYDFVAVMWSGLERTDIPVEDISQFDQCTTTSFTQSLKNDWPEKKIHPVNDQDLVEKNWVFVYPSQTQLKDLRFAEFVKYQDLNICIKQSLIHMISLQSVLSQLNIPYVFCFYMDYVDQLKLEPMLYSLLDQKSICCDDNLYNISQHNNSKEADGFHPGISAQKAWANILEKFINAKTQ
jgi:hypothetical protein